MDCKRVLASAAVLAVMACGGGGDSGTNPTNHAPKVVFTFTPLATEKSVPVDLTITATDEDGDPLTISWTATRGSLAAQNSKKTVMRWTVPSTVGFDTVRVSVSDGTATSKLTEAIGVATALKSLPMAPSLFEKAKSPYVISFNPGSPRLPVLGTTVIEAGTSIYISTPAAFFDVSTRLEAHGTAGEPVVFRQNDRTLVCGANTNPWAGIQASDTAVVDLHYTQIWNAQNGVRLFDSAIALMTNCAVRCSGSAGASVEGYGALRAIDSQFTDGQGDGVAIAQSFALPDSVIIQRCTLSFNRGSGIRMDLNDNAKAVVIDVQYNNIEFNQTHGISLARAVFPQIHFNYFSGNGDESVSSLYLQSGYPSVANAELDATCNFWGNTTQSTIDVGIHDSLDQATVHTRVKSCPWLNSNPLTTTPNCSMSCP